MSYVLFDDKDFNNQKNPFVYRNELFIFKIK